MSINKKQDILYEKLAELEHIQWEKWSKELAQTLRRILLLIRNEEYKDADKVIVRRLKKWESNWKAYSELPEDVKDYDRVWVDKIINIVEEILEEFKKDPQRYGN